MTDQDFFKEAVRVGNLQAEPRNFGAVVVKDGKIIATGNNQVHETNDPAAHAEITAIREACQKLGTHNLEGCTLYGSHEPCLMCFSCAVWARMSRIVYATPANETTHDTYEFDGINLQELAARHKARQISVELIPIQP